MSAPNRAGGPLPALVALYDAMVARGDAPRLGYAIAKISFTIVLSAEGEVQAVHDQRSGEGKARRPRPIDAPQRPKRTFGIASGLLWDKTSYALGVTARSDPGGRATLEHTAFKARHRRLLQPLSDSGARAFLAFLDLWRPEDFVDLPGGFQEDMLDMNVTFSLDGDEGLLFDRPAFQALVITQSTSPDAEQSQCLVSGEAAPIARLHPLINGVAGAQSSGASLVSFAASASTSYGHIQGANAPTSEHTAFSYAAALNRLLSASAEPDANGRAIYRNRLLIGDTTTVFWAEGDPAYIEVAERLVAGLLGGPTAQAGLDPSSERAGVLLAELDAGRRLSDLDSRLHDVRICILSLSPNAARLAVRLWHEGGLGVLSDNVQAHWRDLHLEPSGFKLAPPLWRLLVELAPQDEFKNIPPGLAGDVTRSVLDGAPYPRTLLIHMLMRVRSDRGEGALNEARVRILRAALARDVRLSQGALVSDEMLVSFDMAEQNVGYRLGRLFAVLEAIQMQASPLKPTLRERHYALASASPARAFPLLVNGAHQHLMGVRQSRIGLAIHFERAFVQVMSGLSATLPLALSLEDQARFAIGYYHQRAALYTKGEIISGAAEASSNRAISKKAPR